MTCSSSAFLLPSCGKRSWDRGKQKGEKGEANNLIPIYLYRPVWKIQRLVPALLYSRCLWALPAHAWSLQLPLSYVSVPCPVPPVAVSAALP